MGNKGILAICSDSTKEKSALNGLEKEGYEIFEENDVRKALYFLRYYCDYVNMIIFVVRSGPCKGLEMCKEIRKFTEVPIIVITGRDEEYDELYSSKAENIEFFSKLSSTDIFIKRVNAILKEDETDIIESK